MTAALRPDRDILFAVLDVSTSRYFDVSCIPIVALLLCLIVLTSVSLPYNVPRTTMHTTITSRLLYRNKRMLTMLATGDWILLVVIEEEVSHSLLMNNYGVSR